MTETPMRERLARVARSTELRLPGSLFDLLCTTRYANDHSISLLILDVVDAFLAELERPSEGMIQAAWRMVTRDLIDGRTDAMVALIEAVIRAAREGK